MLTVLRPDAPQRVVVVEGHWGVDPHENQPADPNSCPIVPTAGYGYDTMLGLWVPVSVSSSGSIIEAFSLLIANNLAAILSDTTSIDQTADSQLSAIGNLVSLVNTRYGGNEAPYLWNSLLNSVTSIGFRKILNVDAGAYAAVAAGALAINYTGVNLAGTGVPTGITAGVVWNATDRTLHGIVSVTDPAGANPGVITLDRPINTAGAILYVPYAALPHAYNSAADAMQTLAVVGDPPRINGPSTFINVAAAVIAANVQYVLPCALYARDQIQIVWTCAGTSKLQFNAYGKYDNAAWAAVGTIPAGYLINGEFKHTGNSVFGAPPIGGAAVTNIIKASLKDPEGYDSVAIEMIVLDSGGNSTVTGTYRLQGGTT